MTAEIAGVTVPQDTTMTDQAADEQRILIFLTAYNEAKSIGSLLDDLLATASELEAEMPHTVDILVVDDCSSDDTKAVIRDRDINLIRHPRNLGPGAATRTGYMYAVRNGYDATVRMDADGQHRPSDIPALLEPVLDEDADIVIGSRFITEEGYDPPLMRHSGIRFYSELVSAITGNDVSDITSGFRAVSRPVIKEHAENMPNGIIAINRGLREGLGDFDIEERPVEMQEREHGQSYLDTAQMAKYPVYAFYSMILTLFRLGS